MLSNVYNGSKADPQYRSVHNGSKGAVPCYAADMSIDLVHVLAEVRLLPTDEGGKTVPICGSYRPNHNFFDADDAVMTAGFIELPDGVVVKPGEAITVPIAFWWWPGLSEQIYPGREWRIQEGPNLVGFGRIIEVQDGGQR
jgi:translation elongation factor EF-Tu-like GTPase